MRCVLVSTQRLLTITKSPPLDEGVLLYMPSTVAGISITEAKRLVQLTDARLRSLPEVAQVLGKAGRADTSTDVAALSMLETIVVLKPREQHTTVVHFPRAPYRDDDDMSKDDAYLCVILRDTDRAELAFSTSGTGCAKK